MGVNYCRLMPVSICNSEFGMLVAGMVYRWNINLSVSVRTSCTGQK